MWSDSQRRYGMRTVTVLLAGLFFLALFMLFRAEYAAFTHSHWALYDYGIYTNMIWNTGRGRPFLCLVDRSYLTTHLSFTLGLLGPLYWIWDHPLLLMVCGWALFCGGCWWVWRSCRAQGFSPVLTWAVMIFFVLWPFTQSAMLSSFRGVTGYLLLLPWLYYTASFRKSQTALPLILLLGLREDAFLFGLPILIYVALRDRWPRGGILAGLSLVYGLLALLVIYPWINQITLLERRGQELADGNLLHVLNWAALQARAPGALYIFLPALLLIRRGMWRYLALVLIPTVITLGSAFERQFLLQNHYPSVIVASMIIALVETLGRDPRRKESGLWRHPALIGGLLILLTFWAHHSRGFLPGGAQSSRRFIHPHGSGRVALRAAAQLPKEGLLLVPNPLGGVVGNRRDVLSDQHYDAKRHRVDLVFARPRYFIGGSNRLYREILHSGEFGLRYFDDVYVILERGIDPSTNLPLLERLAEMEERRR